MTIGTATVGNPFRLIFLLKDVPNSRTARRAIVPGFS